MYDLLRTIDDPAALRRLPSSCRDWPVGLRVESVSRTGGHLSSNLGTSSSPSRCTTSSTPDDRLVWDVGHQTYPHKILTGRRERMHTLRQQDGISGFPRRVESEYDTFGTAHSPRRRSPRRWAWRAASAAGRGPARHRRHRRRRDDGNGQAFEALNNAGVCGTRA